MAEQKETNSEAVVSKKKTEKKPPFFKRWAVKIKKFFRDYISELKKVSWSSKESVRKNTILVVVSVVVVAIVIGLIDLAFSSAIQGIAGLI